jgi:hypothetical protein
VSVGRGDAFLFALLISNLYFKHLHLLTEVKAGTLYSLPFVSENTDHSTKSGCQKQKYKNCGCTGELEAEVQVEATLI